MPHSRAIRSQTDRRDKIGIDIDAQCAVNAALSGGKRRDRAEVAVRQFPQGGKPFACTRQLVGQTERRRRQVGAGGIDLAFERSAIEVRIRHNVRGEDKRHVRCGRAQRLRDSVARRDDDRLAPARFGAPRKRDHLGKSRRAQRCREARNRDIGRDGPGGVTITMLGHVVVIIGAGPQIEKAPTSCRYPARRFVDIRHLIETRRARRLYRRLSPVSGSSSRRTAAGQIAPAAPAIDRRRQRPRRIPGLERLCPIPGSGRRVGSA